MSEGRLAYGPERFAECPRYDLISPDRLYIDAYGFVQICPGIAIGNIHKDSLIQIIKGFRRNKNYILRTLIERGPNGLIQETELNPNEKYVDACHCCYAARLALLDEYPDLLGPRQVYGF